MKTLIVASAAIVANILLILLGMREYIVQRLLVVCGVVLVAFPLALVSAIFLLISLRNHSAVLRRIAKWGFLVTIVVVSTIPSLVVSDTIATRQVEEAKRFCDHLVPELDRWKEQHGTYPAQLSDLGHATDLPRLVHPWSYDSSGQEFHFMFRDARNMSDRHDFYSIDRQWQESEPSD